MSNKGRVDGVIAQFNGEGYEPSWRVSCGHMTSSGNTQLEALQCLKLMFDIELLASDLDELRGFLDGGDRTDEDRREGRSFYDRIDEELRGEKHSE